MEKKRIYIADIHMNAGRGFKKSNSVHPYEWLGKEEANRFAKFLEYLNDSATIREVVILGDLMDDWVYPVNEEPPSLQDILDASINKNIFQALRKLSQNEKINVLYLPGNHDMGATKELIAKNFPGKKNSQKNSQKNSRGMVFGGTALNNSVYRTSRLRAEHGSAHAMFNAPDAINSPGSRLPLGYFISRVIATKARDTGHADRHYWTYADDLLEILGPQKLGTSVFEAVLEEADLDDDTKIHMPKRNGKSKIVTAGQVKEKYAALYDQWKKTHGIGLALKAMMAEVGLLGRMADHLCKQGDTNIVVFGHSHDWKLDKDVWFVEDRIYANCGTWCDEKKPCTWVESQKDRGKNRHIVRVMDWNNGKPKRREEAHVPL
jgi:UDP-2,3-diacylglucosamine pyrophosphatase LpxH